MAKLNDTSKEIDESLCRLLKGDISQPVKIEGGGGYRDCLKHIEELRIKLIQNENECIEAEYKNKSAIASVIHDLKTPLAVISGYVECLQDGMSDKDYVQLIGDKTMQLNEKVLRLLDSTKDEIAHSAEEMRLIDTKTYFEEICERLNLLSKKNKSKLKISKIPSKNIRISPSQIERVIQNIVSNALKYSIKNPKINISFSATHKDFVIKIKDTGIGIAKEDLPFIFNQFYKADKARTDESSNGIGLFTVKNIVEAHGGSITVKSKVNKGSTFTISLPLVFIKNENTTATKFEHMPRALKIFLYLLFGFPTSFIYRVICYKETLNYKALIGAILSIVLLPLAWIFDLISVIVYGDIVFLVK